MTVIFKSIRPRKVWREEVFVEVVREAAKREADIIERMFDKVVATWKDKPKFVKEIKIGVNKVTIIVRGNKTQKASQILAYLDKGTKRRWALMSKDFSPKTTHRTIGSRRGSGKAVVRGRMAMTARGISARPGIKAREFSDEIAKRRQPFWTKNMQEAMKKGARKLWN